MDDYTHPKYRIEPPYTSVESEIDIKLPTLVPYLTETVGWRPRLTTLTATTPPTNCREYACWQYMTQTNRKHPEGDFDRGSDFKRYQLPRVISHLIKSLSPPSKTPPLRLAVLCHDDTFALELAVIIYLLSVGYRVSHVTCYNPSVKYTARLYQMLPGYASQLEVEYHPVLERIHFFNSDTIADFYTEIKPGLDLVWGLNCAIPLQMITPRKSEGFLAVCSQYAYFQSLSYPTQSLAESYLTTKPPVPSYSYVCDDFGYYGSLRIPTPLLSKYLAKLKEQLVITRTHQMGSQIVFPLVRPPNLTDLDLYWLFVNPYLNLQHRPNFTDLALHNVGTTWIIRWYREHFPKK